MMRAFAMLVLLAASGCKSEGGAVTAQAGSGSGSAGAGSAAAGSGSATKPARAGGGFSSDLAKQLEGPGDGSAVAMAGSGQGSAGESPDPPAGSAAKSAGSAAKDGSSAANNGGSVVVVKTDNTGSAAAVAKPVVAGSATPSKPIPVSKIGNAVVIKTGPVTAKPAVAVSAELKAINISLLPNWERDVEAAGTISLFVKIPKRTGEMALFVFRYGIEDASAPAERDAYKKWLADNKILNAAMDRQRGAAWYLEGTDGSGRAAFRFVVNYGGKKLICFGSLYKDGASNQLGDLRDQTLIQAKQICETLTL